MTSIVWSGCGTYYYVHPLRCLIRLGNLRVVALIDSGSDYDAIDHDLSIAEELRQNPAFRGRIKFAENVSGFAEGMKLKSEFVSDCDVTLCGAPIAGGRKRQCSSSFDFH